VDAGAEKALKNGSSLLPCGITSFEGRFKKGEVVRINGFGKGLINCSSTELQAKLAKCQQEKKEGKNTNGSAVVNHENLIMIE
jgi:glutamate 5-kinase